MTEYAESDQSVIHIIFVHGWAMLTSDWEILIALIRQELPDAVITSFNCYDQSVGKINLRKNYNYIWIGHSFGFLRLWLEHNLIDNEISAAISINSFTYLPQSVDNSGLRKGNLSKVNIEKMLSGLQKAPEQTLKYFYRQAGLSKDQIKGHLAYFRRTRRLNLLQEELMLMQNADVRQAIGKYRIPILSLAADRDKIVNQELWQQSFARICPANQNHIELKQINSSSHCLHLAEPAWCAKAIVCFIRAYSIF